MTLSDVSRLSLEILKNISNKNYMISRRVYPVAISFLYIEAKKELYN